MRSRGSGSCSVPSGFSLSEGEFCPPGLINDVSVSQSLLAHTCLWAALSAPPRAVDRMHSPSPVCVWCFLPDTQDAREAVVVIFRYGSRGVWRISHREGWRETFLRGGHISLHRLAAT